MWCDDDHVVGYRVWNVGVYKGVTLGIDFNDGKVAKFFSLANFFLILMTITL